MVINEDPLKYDLSKFMNFLKSEFEAIIVRSKTLPQYETDILEILSSFMKIAKFSKFT
jgi:hypothetical protein